MRDLLDVWWFGNSEGRANLVLYLKSDERLRLNVQGAGIWKYMIDEWTDLAAGFGIGMGESYTASTLSVVHTETRARQ